MSAVFKKILKHVVYAALSPFAIALVLLLAAAAWLSVLPAVFWAVVQGPDEVERLIYPWRERL